MKGYRLKSAKGGGAWSRAERDQVWSFQLSAPSGAVWPVLAFSSSDVWHDAWSTASTRSSPEPGCPGFSLEVCHMASRPACLVDLGLQPLEVELIPCDPRPPLKSLLLALTIWCGPRPQVNKDTLIWKDLPGASRFPSRSQGQGPNLSLGRVNPLLHPLKERLKSWLG